MRAPEKQDAVPGSSRGGTAGKFVHLWRAIKNEVSREQAAEQITSAPPIDHPLPCVRDAYMRDRAARIALGLPLANHGLRIDFASAITTDEFAAATRRGRRK